MHEGVEIMLVHPTWLISANLNMEKLMMHKEAGARYEIQAYQVNEARYLASVNNPEFRAMKRKAEKTAPQRADRGLCHDGHA